MGEASMAKKERFGARDAKRGKIWGSRIFGQRHPDATHGGKRALQLGICAVVLSIPGILSLFWGAPVTATWSQGQEEVAQEQTPVQPRMSGSDCSFLENPAAYEGLDGRHRIDLSRRTEEVTGELLMRTAATLVPAQEIPRRNFIDQHLFDKMARAGVNSAPLSTDEEFLRRVTLDLTGRLPEPNAVRQFLLDTSATKRDQLVDRLIASPEFVDKWTLFFGDLFRNNSNSTAIQRFASGREAFHQYLQEAVQNNRAYNLIASDLLTAEVTRRENLCEPTCIGPLELHLSLDGHIPLAHAIHQPPVLGFRVAECGRHQHMVVGREGGDPLSEGGLEKR